VIHVYVYGKKESQRPYPNLNRSPRWIISSNSIDRCFMDNSSGRKNETWLKFNYHTNIIFNPITEKFWIFFFFIYFICYL